MSSGPRRPVCLPSAIFQPGRGCGGGEEENCFFTFKINFKLIIIKGGGGWNIEEREGWDLTARGRRGSAAQGRPPPGAALLSPPRGKEGGREAGGRGGRGAPPRSARRHSSPGRAGRQAGREERGAGAA